MDKILLKYPPLAKSLQCCLSVLSETETSYIEYVAMNSHLSLPGFAVKNVS